MEYSEIIERALNSPWTLIAVLVSGAILFVFMMREVAAWFFRISSLEKRIVQMQETLSRIDERLTAELTRAGSAQKSALDLIERTHAAPGEPRREATLPEAPAPDAAKPSKPGSFPLQH
ncbi:MAG TPA: hypothetical protein VFV50_04650 [Bdellovibrionales bacterium]|nr:hypothetical protein [Bdellovibrionales bacterium]